MENQPKIALPTTREDKILDAAAVIALLVLWCLTAFLFIDLPEKVPMHFGLSGKPNRFDDRNSIFFLPALATAIFGLLSWMLRFPHRFNYIQKITPENAERQYRLACRMLRWLRVSVVALFLFSVWLIASAAKTEGHAMPKWALPIILLLAIGPVFFFLFKMSRPSKS